MATHERHGDEDGEHEDAHGVNAVPPASRKDDALAIYDENAQSSTLLHREEASPAPPTAMPCVSVEASPIVDVAHPQATDLVTYFRNSRALFEQHYGSYGMYGAYIGDNMMTDAELEQYFELRFTPQGHPYVFPLVNLGNCYDETITHAQRGSKILVLLIRTKSKYMTSPTGATSVPPVITHAIEVVRHNDEDWVVSRASHIFKRMPLAAYFEQNCVLYQFSTNVLVDRFKEPFKFEKFKENWSLIAKKKVKQFYSDLALNAILTKTEPRRFKPYEQWSEEELDMLILGLHHSMNAATKTHVLLEKVGLDFNQLPSLVRRAQSKNMWKDIGFLNLL